jgi:hypothetical protein
MGAQPSLGGDELRARALLHTLGARPFGHAHTTPPRTAMASTQWRSRLNAALTNATTTRAQPTKRRKTKRKQRHNPAAPRTAWDTRPPSPRQSLADAWDRVPYRLKWLAYHASAAYLGWTIGLVGWATYVTAWIARTGLVGPQAIFWYLVGAATLLLHHRTRTWWRPVAWLAAVPASSTVVGVLLYGTPSL